MAATRLGCAYNILSRFVIHFENGLYYEDRISAFCFCKEELSSQVTLRHDYSVRPSLMPFELNQCLRLGVASRSLNENRS